MRTRRISGDTRNEPPVLLVKWYDVTKWLLCYRGVVSTVSGLNRYRCGPWHEFGSRHCAVAAKTRGKVKSQIVTAEVKGRLHEVTENVTAV